MSRVRNRCADPELRRAEIDAGYGDVEACLELAEHAAVAAADFQDRLGPIGRHRSATHSARRRRACWPSCSRK